MISRGGGAVMMGSWEKTCEIMQEADIKKERISGYYGKKYARRE